MNKESETISSVVEKEYKDTTYSQKKHRRTNKKTKNQIDDTTSYPNSLYSLTAETPYNDENVPIPEWIKTSTIDDIKKTSKRKNRVRSHVDSSSNVNLQSSKYNQSSQDSSINTNSVNTNSINTKSVNTNKKLTNDMKLQTSSSSYLSYDMKNKQSKTFLERTISNDIQAQKENESKRNKTINNEKHEKKNKSKKTIPKLSMLTLKEKDYYPNKTFELNDENISESIERFIHYYTIFIEDINHCVITFDTIVNNNNKNKQNALPTTSLLTRDTMRTSNNNNNNNNNNTITTTTTTNNNNTNTNENDNNNNTTTSSKNTNENDNNNNNNNNTTSTTSINDNTIIKPKKLTISFTLSNEKESNTRNRVRPTVSQTYSILLNCFVYLFQSNKILTYGQYQLDTKLATLLFSYLQYYILPQKDEYLIKSTFDQDIRIVQSLLSFSMTHPHQLIQYHPLYMTINKEIFEKDSQRFIIQYLYILLGRLYMTQELSLNSINKNKDDNKEIPFQITSKYLYSALLCNPLYPLPRFYLSEVAATKNSLFDSIFHAFLCLDTGSGIQTRETLGHLFERARKELTELEKLKKKQRSTKDIPNGALKLMTLRILNCNGVLFTKIGIDNFITVLDKINSSFLQLLYKVLNNQLTLPSNVIPRLICLSILSIFNSISPLGTETDKTQAVIQTTYIDNTPFSVTTPSAFLLLLYIIKIISKVYIDNSTTFGTYFMPSFYLFSLYIYTYPSILDCPDIPFDYLMTIFAGVYRKLPQNPSVPLVFDHKTDKPLNNYVYKDNDINNNDNNINNIDIHNNIYINSIAKSIPTELIELVGVNHFYNMILNSLPCTAVSQEDIRLTIIYKCQEIFLFKKFMEFRDDHCIYAVTESYDMPEEKEEEENMNINNNNINNNNENKGKRHNNKRINTLKYNNNNNEKMNNINNMFMNEENSDNENNDMLKDLYDEKTNNVTNNDNNNDNNNETQSKSIFNVDSSILTASSSLLSRQRKQLNNAPLTSDEFAQIRTMTKQTQSNSYKPLIVVDAPNVCVKCGKNNAFISQGLKTVLDYYKSRGHKVISFIPDYYLNYKDVGKKQRLIELGMNTKDNGKRRTIQIPDDIPLLEGLVNEGYLITTPSQDYDDSYCIEYAQQNDGCIISNDMYRDYIQKYDVKQSNLIKRWLKAHLISYTFVGTSFVPNPDFIYPEPLIETSSIVNNNHENLAYEHIMEENNNNYDNNNEDDNNDEDNDDNDDKDNNNNNDDNDEDNNDDNDTNNDTNNDDNNNDNNNNDNNHENDNDDNNNQRSFIPRRRGEVTTRDTSKRMDWGDMEDSTSDSSYSDSSYSDSNDSDSIEIHNDYES